MSGDDLTTAHLDYVQRTALEPGPIDLEFVTGAPPEARALFHVRGIGRHDKVVTGDHRDSAERLRVVTEDLLSGLHTYELPVAFMVRGRPDGVDVHIGTWLADGNGDVAAATAVAGNAAILRALLASLYPAVDLAPVPPTLIPLGASGLALGIPTLKTPASLDGALPIDRLVRAMAGAHWGVLVLAQPVREIFTRDLRLQVINEMRAAATASKAGGFPSPLAEHYVDLLKTTMVSLSNGQSTGAWRTGVYLLGDSDSYYRLTSAWRGIFAGEGSVPEPVRLWDRPEAARLAESWALPSGPPGAGPGFYQRPFEHQTLLTSSQLSAYVHFPEVETGGFAITTLPDFDTVPPPDRAGFPLGQVIERGIPTTRSYVTAPEDLTRHVFVAGTTGSGKTNTVFHLLQQAAGVKVPFLVIEPAKAEYRAFLDDPSVGADMQVFTLGDENVSPFRLNPFECPPGVPVAVHLDLLRSVFNVSFGMWTPLPQVLEACLYRIYEDRGWDVTANRNRRLDDRSDQTRAFPTLSDLAAKVDEVSAKLGYEEKVTADIRAALRTRLDSLRTGGKGRMLDVQRSLPIEVLTGRPTVLELEGMGDDDDKAFVMGLVLIRIVENLRALGPREGLRHLLVVEEAHRLLAATGPVGQGDEVQADVRGKAVETFANMLSEIRAYGQGVVVVDQVPSKLAPEVVKNTNLKIGHRIVAGDDRAIMASSMAMNVRQERALATLRRGQVAVFGEGDDAPLLVQVPAAKRSAASLPDAARVRAHMASAGPLATLPTLFLPSGDCGAACAASPEACAAARVVADNVGFRDTFARAVMSTLVDEGALDRLRDELIAVIEPLRSPWMPSSSLLASLWAHAARQFVARLGSQGGWSYAVTDELGDALHRMVEATPAEVTTARAAFREQFRAALGQDVGPYPACSRIWDPDDAPCICRFAVADLVARRTLDEAWQSARSADADEAIEGRPRTWDVCQDAAYQLVEFPADPGDGDGSEDEELQARIAAGGRRFALCFAQQALTRDDGLHPRTRQRVMDDLMVEAGVDVPTN